MITVVEEWSLLSFDVITAYLSTGELFDTDPHVSVLL
jgi:hypothetical protein